MTLGELFEVPAGTIGTLLTPPNIQVMLTGARLALIEPTDRVSLLYIDGSIERAFIPMAERPIDFMALVSAVQTAARAESDYVQGGQL